MHRPCPLSGQEQPAIKVRATSGELVGYAHRRAQQEQGSRDAEAVT